MNAPLLWTHEDVDRVTGGRSTRAWQAMGVSIDSRTLAKGDLFVAIEGPRVDGHAYLGDAHEKGAAAAIVHRRPRGRPKELPLVEVRDTLGALWDLGAAARARTSATVVAVTGSAGKTGVKEALRLALETQASTAASAASFNNHWGTPLSLARMAPETVYGVFEVGMNRAGEIRRLTRLVQPHVAVITNVLPAHIGYFDSIFDIADAKAEIFEGLLEGGTAVLPRDNPLFHQLRDKAESVGVSRIVSFGMHHDAEFRLLALETKGDGSEVTASCAGQEVRYRIGAPGRHWAINSLAVLAAVQALGADIEIAARELAKVEPGKGRGARRTIRIPGGSYLLIDDSYNANPASVRAACEVMGGVRPGSGGRRIAVLGEMRELGVASPELHRNLALPIKTHGIDLVFTCGNDMQALREALPNAKRGAHAPDSDELAPLVAAAVRAGDVVLVKGSLASRMAVVVKALEALGETGATPTDEG